MFGSKGTLTHFFGGGRSGGWEDNFSLRDGTGLESLKVGANQYSLRYKIVTTRAGGPKYCFGFVSGGSGGSERTSGTGETRDAVPMKSLL